MNQLSGLLSDKQKKPIIIDGRLVTDGNSLLMAKRERYKVSIVRVLPGQQEEIIENGEEILASVADAFTKRYIGIYGGHLKGEEQIVNHFANVDPFTGAIVLKNELYQHLLDVNNESHFHDGTVQFKMQTQALVDDFTKELVMNYFEIYSSLMNRRLTSSHIPVKIKGHLVAGLFQPLVVGTRHIDCPLQMGEFSWFFDHINSPSPCEVRLESMHETQRGLELSAISMWDFSQKFGTSCMRSLNRRYFQFMMYVILLNTLNPQFSSEMVERYKRLYRSLQSGNGDTAGVMPFFVSFIDGVKKYRSALVVRS